MPLVGLLDSVSLSLACLHPVHSLRWAPEHFQLVGQRERQTDIPIRRGTRRPPAKPESVPLLPLQPSGRPGAHSNLWQKAEHLERGCGRRRGHGGRGGRRQAQVICCGWRANHSIDMLTAAPTTSIPDRKERGKRQQTVKWPNNDRQNNNNHDDENPHCLHTARPVESASRVQQSRRSIGTPSLAASLDQNERHARRAGRKQSKS